MASWRSGATFLAYGLTELVHGYGFVAVFVAALAMRSAERHHAYHDRLHDFAEQTERLLMMVLLVLFGGAVAGGLLAPLTRAGVAAALAFIFVVRPLAGMVAMLGTTQPMAERVAICLLRHPRPGQLLLPGLCGECRPLRRDGGALGGGRPDRTGLGRAARRHGDAGHALAG